MLECARSKTVTGRSCSGRLMPKEAKILRLLQCTRRAHRPWGRGPGGTDRCPGGFPERPSSSPRPSTPTETAADRITHETMAALHTSFITPFDRDEIHQLISGMDDILDLTPGRCRIDESLRYRG